MGENISLETNSNNPSSIIFDNITAVWINFFRTSETDDLVEAEEK